MTGIVSPQDPRGVDLKAGAFNRVWVGFFDALARKANGLAKLGQVVAPAVAAAPAGYDQAHIQTMVTLLNELRAKINVIDTAANG